jgi:outer membrane immunogenic protein
MLKRIAIAAIAVMGMSSAAHAQRTPVFNWSGFYLGASASYMNAPVDWQYYGLTPDTGYLKSRTSTVLPAGHIGWNWQSGSFVYGIEASFQAPAKTQRQCDSPIFCAAFDSYVRMDELITVGPRAGYAFSERWMVYLTGGYAYARVESGFYAKGFPDFAAKTYSGHDGYFIGAGVEHAWRNWLVIGLEYMYVDLESQLQKNTVVPAVGAAHYINPEAHIVRFRLSLKDLVK